LDNKKEVSIKQNENAFWTEDKVNHIKEYGWIEYGYETRYDSKEEFEKDLDEKLQKIKKGDSDKLVNTDREFFDVFCDNEIIGDIVVIDEIKKIDCFGNEITENIAPCEVEISIYDKYADNKYAEKAIKEIVKWFFSEQSKYNRMAATVRFENRNRKRVIKALESGGFKRTFEETFEGDYEKDPCTIWSLDLDKVI